MNDNSDKIILDLCGGTGAWSKPYAAAGYDVRLVTLPENDVRLYEPPVGVHGILAAPPCTEFSFAKHFHGKGNYRHNIRKGMEVVSACMRIVLICQPRFWAIENPSRSKVWKYIRTPDYVFQPWQFGDNYQKQTAILGKFNNPKPTVIKKPVGLVKFSMMKSRDIAPEHYGKLTRQERRAITPSGFAKAFFEANP